VRLFLETSSIKVSDRSLYPADVIFLNDSFSVAIA
jgi:hypothetical protein